MIPVYNQVPNDHLNIFQIELYLQLDATMKCYGDSSLRITSYVEDEEGRKATEIRNDIRKTLEDNLVGYSFVYIDAVTEDYMILMITAFQSKEFVTQLLSNIPNVEIGRIHEFQNENTENPNKIKIDEARNQIIKTLLNLNKKYVAKYA